MAAARNEVVGREEELAEVEAFLRNADALPAALLLEGEAGIGKTTIWRHGAASAAERGAYRVLSCSPSESEIQLSFAAAGDLLADVAEETLRALPPPQRRALAAALLLEDASGPPPDQRAVALAFFGALRALAAAGPPRRSGRRRPVARPVLRAAARVRPPARAGGAHRLSAREALPARRPTAARPRPRV